MTLVCPKCTEEFPGDPPTEPPLSRLLRPSKKPPPRDLTFLTCPKCKVRLELF